jgi:hypothetical protein
MFTTEQPGEHFFRNLFDSHPRWRLRVMPDSFEQYDLDSVLHGKLRDFMMQPGTLHFSVASEDHEVECWIYEITLVLSPNAGVWVVGWATRRRFREICREVDGYHAMLERELVLQMGWKPEEIPLHRALIFTHEENDGLELPSGWEPHQIIGSSELPDLAHKLCEPVDDMPAHDPRRSMRLIADLLELGYFSDGNDLLADVEPELPAWMVGRPPEEQNDAGVVAGKSVRVPGKRVGKNAKCPCGSGRKFKRCCY